MGLQDFNGWQRAFYSKDGDIHTFELPEVARPELVATVEGKLVDRHQAASADIVWEDLETESPLVASTDPVTEGILCSAHRPDVRIFRCR